MGNERSYAGRSPSTISGGAEAGGCEPERSLTNRIVCVDMDGVLVDSESGLQRVPASVRARYEARHYDDGKDHFDDIPGIFALMDPMPDAIESYRELAGLFDTYILSTAPWANPSAGSDKLIWVRRHLDDVAQRPPRNRRSSLVHERLSS